MSSPHSISPQTATRLAELAQELRQLVYEKEGVPEWGTLFTEIEDEGMQLGMEIARLFMEQSVQQQANQVPPQALDDLGEHHETVPQGTRTKTAILETPAGEVQWEQPKTHLPQAKRDFFPSGQSAGDQH